MLEQLVNYVNAKKNHKVSIWMDSGEYGVEIESDTGNHLVTGTGDSLENAERAALVLVGFLES